MDGHVKWNEWMNRISVKSAWPVSSECSDRIRFWQNFILEIVLIYFWKKSDCILWNLADFILSKWRTGVYLFLNSLNAVLSSTIIFSWKNSVSLSCSTKTFTKPTLNISPISPSLSYSSFSWKNRKNSNQSSRRSPCIFF